MVKPRGGMEAARDDHPIGAFYRPGGGNRVDKEGGKRWSAKWIPSMRALLEYEAEQWKRRGFERKGQDGAWLHYAPEGAWQRMAAMAGKPRAAVASISCRR
jgi:hypothetical protein